MIALLPTLSAIASDGADPPRWDWTQPHRYYLESQVRLPLFMWFKTPFNQQARVTAFEVRVVTSCQPGVPAGRGSLQVWCSLDDVSLAASAMEADEGLLEPIVGELDDLLTGAAVQLVVRPDGRLVGLDLEEVDRRNQRVGLLTENLRLVLSRAFAGLDLELPAADDAAWPQYGAWLMRVPSARGSTGLTEVVHRVTASDGGLLTIASGGRGTIVHEEPASLGVFERDVAGYGVENRYDTRMTGTAAFDARTGRLLDREWLVVGVPTASSWISIGAAGYPYIQHGRVVALGAEQAWDVGESRELPPGEAAQTAIQAAVHLGAD